MMNMCSSIQLRKTPLCAGKYPHNSLYITIFITLPSLVGKDHSLTVTLYTESTLFCLSSSHRSIKYLAVSRKDVCIEHWGAPQAWCPVSGVYKSMIAL